MGVVLHHLEMVKVLTEVVRKLDKVKLLSTKGFGGSRAASGVVGGINNLDVVALDVDKTLLQGPVGPCLLRVECSIFLTSLVALIVRREIVGRTRGRRGGCVMVRRVWFVSAVALELLRRRFGRHSERGVCGRRPAAWRSAMRGWPSS